MAAFVTSSPLDNSPSQVMLHNVCTTNEITASKVKQASNMINGAPRGAALGQVASEISLGAVLSLQQFMSA
jgi:hypothetical protein